MGNKCVSMMPCCIHEEERHPQGRSKERPPVGKNHDLDGRDESGTITFKYHKNTCALEYYEPVKFLGEGSISSIHLVRRRPERVDIPYRERADIKVSRASDVTSETSSVGNSERLYVLKSIMKDHVKNDEYLEEMRSEIHTMKYLDHPNIIKVYEGFERKRHIYLVMEYSSGGDLYERLPCTEREAASIVRQILTALSYLHKNNVVHRDLKFENVVFESKDSNAQIKIIDFGLATKYLSDEYKMTDRVGTIYTMAPQVIQGMYTSACDLWSVGVIAYMLLSGGQMPFDGPTRKHVINKIMRCKYHFEGDAWKTISQEAKDFVSSLLKMDPSERPTAQMALQSKWLRKEFPPSDRIPERQASMEACNNMHRYSQESKLKRLALLLIAHNSSTKEIAELRDLFAKYDRNSDGLISFEEFRRVLPKTHLKREDIKKIFYALDMNKDGVINYTEFIAATLETKGRIETQRIKETFDRFDVDDSGQITKENMRQILSLDGKKISDSVIDNIFDEVGGDANNISAITYDEFRRLFEEQKKTGLETFCCDISHKPSSDDESDLVSETAIIPGGKYAIDSVGETEAHHVYDDKSKSMRRYDSFQLSRK